MKTKKAKDSKIKLVRIIMELVREDGERSRTTMRFDISKGDNVNIKWSRPPEQTPFLSHERFPRYVSGPISYVTIEGALHHRRESK